jgi:hypothetical protein
MGLFFVERDGKEFYVKVFSDGKVIEYFDPWYNNRPAFQGVGFTPSKSP